jgi:hypothetical protein
VIEIRLLSRIDRVNSSSATSIRLVIRLVSSPINSTIYTSRLEAIGAIRGLLIVLIIGRSILGSLLLESLLSLS